MAIEVPEKIDGFEVTEIGDYAFSQPIGDVVKLNFTTSPIEEIILPNSIKKIGRICILQLPQFKENTILQYVERYRCGSIYGVSQGEGD